jgi:hypothetical protein
MTRWVSRSVAAAGVVAVALAVGLVATAAPAGARRPTVPARALRSYIGQIERVRLPVDKLLDGIDPILDAFHAKRTTSAQASAQMNALEERFAGYVLAMQEIDPRNPTLNRVNKPYAYTYYLEDNFLSTLASDLNEGDFDNLPTTQDQQRLAIIIWRTQLELLAKLDGVTLPGDLQQAGRGEIAPSLSGS